MTATPPGEPSPGSPEERIRAQFPDAIEAAVLTVDFPTLTIRREQIVPVGEFVKSTLDYRHPSCASGVDRKEHLEVVYHVYSLEERRFLGLKVKVPSEDPRMDSMTAVWRGMDWQEREIYDLLGIIFEGHPDLRRILMPEEFTAFPLRKDYPMRGRGERHNFPVLTRSDG
jgi:NADH/F420H2 dehydrogenase subunit C